MQEMPFQTVDQGLARDDVAEMLEVQMELAKSDPEQALARLGEAEFRDASPGVASDEVATWVDAQREWLLRRIAAANPIASAVDAFARAADDLKRAVELELQASEARIAKRENAAYVGHDALVRASQARLEETLADARRSIRKDAKKIRRKALDDAERILDRAGREAARIIMQAEDERRQAHASVEQSRSVQEELLASIDAAQASVAPNVSQRAA